MSSNLILPTPFFFLIKIILATWDLLCLCASALTDKWLKKVWYIYTMEFYSVIKNSEITLFAGIWMELEIIMLSEIRQRKTNMLWYCLYVESLKKIQNLQKRNRLTDLENKVMVSSGRG